MTPERRQIASLAIIGIFFLSSFMSVGHLTWSETIRLGGIAIGLVLVYLRYRSRLDEPGVGRGASLILAMTIGFTVTQFDPNTSAIQHYADTLPGPPGRLATLCALGLFAVQLTGPPRRSVLPAHWDNLDRLVLGIVAVAMLLSIGSYYVVDGTLDAASLIGPVRLLLLALIWLGATRCFQSADKADDRLYPFAEPWRLSLVLVLVLFVPTVCYGAARIVYVRHHFDAGQEAMRRSDYPAARHSYEQADLWNQSVRLIGLSDSYLSDLAAVNLAQGDDGAAEEIINRLRRETPEVVEADLKVADIYLRGERWAAAADLYARSLEVLGRSPQVIDRLGRAYLSGEDSRSFLTMVERFDYMPRIETERYEELLFLGNIQFYRGRFGDALANYRRALEVRPSSSFAAYKAGRSHSALNNCDEATKHYEFALEQDATLADAHYQIGRCLETKGEIDVAHARFRLALELLPNHHESKRSLNRGDKTPQ
ncbi:MAG: hypothetical protein CME19_18525 [Gemmatimonadetes bacterium]|nr:hypothetical protein [Gemmatimonadota bacterium]